MAALNRNQNTVDIALNVATRTQQKDESGAVFNTFLFPALTKW